MIKYTMRTAFIFIDLQNEKEKPFCIMQDGKLLKGIRSTSKTRMGVKFNRLIRLRARLEKHRENDDGNM